MKKTLLLSACLLIGFGVLAAQDVPKAGTVKSKDAKIYIVPAGATFTEESMVVDETQIKGQPRNAPASKKSNKGSN
jgi:hypothetical protein